MPREQRLNEIADGGLELRPVRSGRDRARFVEFPWEIYADDPHWAPPLMLERRAFLNPRRHPFYQFGAAAQFLAERGGKTLGRILVSDDPHYNAYHNANAGCFGMFESVPDPAVAHALLDRAAAWLRERGRTEMLGPIDYSTNYSLGLLVEGFDTPPRLMMNHNPPYYAELLESWGLAKTKDLFAYWFEPNAKIEQWRGRVELMAARANVTLRPFRRDKWREEIAITKEIYQASWSDNWGFTPMTDAEYTTMGRQMIAWAEPSMFLMAEVNGRPAGFSMAIPDFNEALRPLNGRLFRWGLPLGYLRFRRELSRIKTVRLMALGVREEFRKRGIAELMILQTFNEGCKTLGYTGAELSWTLEDNALINRTIESVGGRKYKTYRIYRKEI